MLNKEVCESATISQRSINDDHKERDERRDRFDRALMLCEKETILINFACLWLSCSSLSKVLSSASACMIVSDVHRLCCILSVLVSSLNS